MGDVVYEAVPGAGVKLDAPSRYGHQRLFEAERFTTWIGPNFPCITRASVAAGLIRPVVRRPETPEEWIGKRVRFRHPNGVLEDEVTVQYVTLPDGYLCTDREEGGWNLLDPSEVEVEGESVPPPPPQAEPVGWIVRYTDGYCAGWYSREQADLHADNRADRSVHAVMPAGWEP